jgi:hypothetical protein
MDGTELAPSAACPSASSGPGESPPTAGTWLQRERQEGSEQSRQEGDEGTSMAAGGSAFPAVPSVAAVAAAAGIPGLEYYRQEGRQGAWT